MEEDKKILKRYIEGDAEAFDAIYHKYSKKLFHFALGLVKDQDISKDLVQEIFVNLWEKRCQVDPNLNFDNYIFTITVIPYASISGKSRLRQKFLITWQKP